VPDPVVTALINTYNYGRFVEEAVESVLAQDYPADRMDVIVVDDGSTDDTPKRMERFGERIRYFHLEHKGQAAALNFGVAQARGEIVAFLDADDLWLPQKVRRVVDAIQSVPNAGLVYHAFELWRPDGGEVPQQDFQAISGFLPESSAKLLAFDGQATSGQAFRMQVLREMLPLSEDFVIGCSDGFLAYTSIFEWPAVAIAEPLTKYRLHGENLFSFEKPDAEKMKMKLACWQALQREVKAWLVRRGHKLDEPATAQFMKRHELAERLMQFALREPSRLAFFRFLRDEHSVYRSTWSDRYRAFKLAVAMAGLVLGFRYFYALKNRYRTSIALRGLREDVLPRMREGTLARALVPR
jgi:glycosyltransferase involved in cell wall biosynthesis